MLALFRRCLATGLLFLASCAGPLLRNEKLGDVAKDWSYVIRASQVMPVYPLTEDLFPGDLFLVQTPIDRQQDRWKDRGYLPLDNHLARLRPSGYARFYEDSFDPEQKDKLPSSWLAARDPDSAKAWDLAPKAAFPTYSFAVERDLGFHGALPISGVPAGLSLLGSESAYGTVTLADARTYGVEIESLYQQVRAWAVENRVFLKHFAPADGRVNYLRVVNRIYLVGQVDVSIHASRSGGAELEAGVRPVELLVPSSPRSEESDPDEASADPGVAGYTRNLDAINASLDRSYASGGASAGATFKITAASARSVSLVETFSRPLVIGYLGFDIAILERGDVGPPIPTFAVLELGLKPALQSAALLAANSRLVAVARTLDKMSEGGDSRAQALSLRLDREVGASAPWNYPCHIYDSDGRITRRAGEPLRSDPPQYEDVAKYLGGLLRSIENLKRLRELGLELEGKPEGVDARSHIERELMASEESLGALKQALEVHADLLAEADHYTRPFEEQEGN
jgi:hypothetical protein